MNRNNVFLFIGTGALLILGVLSFTDLPLYLRASVPPLSPSSVSQELSWVPEANTTPGQKKISITASDGKGGTVTKDITISVLPALEPGAPVISDVVITPENNSATVRWVTDVDTDGSAFFGFLNDDSSKRTTYSGRVKDRAQEVIISNLAPCTGYDIQIKAKGDIKETNDIPRTLTTKGCQADSPVKDVAADVIAPDTGGSVTLSDKAGVVVPSLFASQENQFQISQLDRDVVLEKIGNPQDVSPVSGLYDIHALKDFSTITSNFSKSITVTIHYAPASDTDESTLKMYRYDNGSPWVALPDCAVDTSAKTVTCSTDSFSTFGVFGQGGGSTDPVGTPTPAPQSSGGGGGSGSSGGGDSSDGGNEEVATRALRTYTNQAEKDQTVSGPYSGIIKDGTRTVAKLAANSSSLQKKVAVTRDNYWLDVTVKHDQPGPVTFAVYVNNQAWKVVKLDKNDNQYRTHRIGQLRNFAGGTIRFRLLNDTFDKSDPTNEAKDRNLYVDSWQLTTNDKFVSVPLTTKSTATKKATSSASAGRARSAGWAILPNLNQIVTEELGAEFVTPPIWEYYAQRLTIAPSFPLSIQTEGALRNAMRYWKGVRPNDPKGT